MSSANRLSRSELLEGIRDLADDLGETPTGPEMSSKGPYSSSTYANRFGSWVDAVEEAGLEPRARQSISRQDLIDDLAAVAEEIGRPPKADDVRELGRHSVGALYDEFGSFIEARKAAGIFDEPNPNRFSEEDLLEELRRLAESGVPPQRADMNRDGRYSSSTYEKRFGTWGEAVNAAGYSTRQSDWAFYEAVRRGLSDRSWPTVRRAQRDPKCKLCSVEENLEVHHIVPVLRGGTNESWNLMTLCTSCHRGAESVSRRLCPSLLSYADE